MNLKQVISYLQLVFLTYVRTYEICKGKLNMLFFQIYLHNEHLYFGLLVKIQELRRKTVLMIKIESTRHIKKSYQCFLCLTSQVFPSFIRFLREKERKHKKDEK